MGSTAQRWLVPSSRSTRSLKALAKASAYKGLEARVTAVEKAADQAVTELTEITPPAEVAAEHAQFLTALEGFHEESADVGSQVHDRALCTGSATRRGLGNADQTSALRKAVAAVSDKLPGDPLTLTLPSAGQKAGTRPRNGELIRAGNLDGQGQLTINSGGSRRRGDPLGRTQADPLGIRPQGQAGHRERCARRLVQRLFHRRSPSGTARPAASVAIAPCSDSKSD